MTHELNPRFTFDTFVVGAGNRDAVTAARSVAEAPGTAYNPLFIHGAAGLGKTHLLMAIGQMGQTLVPDIHAEYLTLEEFGEALNAAAAAGQTETLRSRFRDVDILLVDDIQFLARRRDLQAELLRLTTLLQAAEKQIVLTSDRTLSEIEELDTQLLAQLDQGLGVDVAPPDYETRLAILWQRAVERGTEFGEGVLDAVAAIEVRNVRELLGLLNRLVAFQAVSDAPLTPGAATAVLAGESAVRAATGGASDAESASPSGAEEFADFLSDVSHTVREQVEAFRSRLGETIKRWEAEGFRTARLEALLQQGAAAGVKEAISDYERDVGRLRALRNTMQGADPGRADDPVFFDPDRVEEAEALVQEATREVAPVPTPSAAWAFESFVGGTANKEALDAALAVAEAPGTRHNPLVLVGPTGVGKTHVLHGIGRALGAKPNALVACLSAHELLDEFVLAFDVNKLDVWRSRYRRVSAFLLDDVHLLAGKQRFQEEVFNLFNAHLEAHRQLVFTLDVPPREVEELDDRIISRLEGGLVVSLTPPDREIRRGIVVQKLRERLGEADTELADYLAARSADSIRAVVGLVQRVLGAAEVDGSPPTVSLARELIEGVSPTAEPRTSTEVRTSGVVVSSLRGIQSREKVVWHWPDPAERIIEEIA